MDYTLLSVTDLSFQYPGGTALEFPNFTLATHQHSLLLGDSGTGKSTLLNLIAGLSKPLRGQVEIKGQRLYDLSNSARDRFRAQHMAFIFQEAHLIKNLTVLENIKIAQSFAGFAVNTAAIRELLDFLQIADKADNSPNELSRGQLQRAAIARALINKPALLIADEPTASLDDRNTELVLNLLMNTANEYGSTLLIATHDKRIKDAFTTTIRLQA